MSTTVTYKGSTLTTVNNQTRTLKTAGKYMEDDVTLVDVTSGGSDGNDFIITLYYEPNVEEGGYYWVPDKTYEEIGAAYTAGKKVTVVADVQSYSNIENVHHDYIPAGCKIETNYGVFLYSVTLPYLHNNDKYLKINYQLYYNGEIYTNSTEEYNAYILYSDPVVVTPTTSQQTITPPSGYHGMTQVTVNAMPTMTLPTSAASSATSGYTSKATIGRSTAAQYINIPPGYNSAGAYYVISAVANGSATAPASISGTAASVSTGTNTLTLTKTISVTPTVSAGYVSAGTAGNASVSLTASVTTKAAATITPTTTNQTIASGTYLTGVQTIAGDADLVGSNILSTANIFGVQGTVVVQNYYTGSSAPSSSLGSNGDLYLQS